MINSLVIKMHQSLTYSLEQSRCTPSVLSKVSGKQGPDVTDGPVSPLKARAESVCDFIRRGADKHSLR